MNFKTDQRDLFSFQRKKRSNHRQIGCLLE